MDGYLVGWGMADCSVRVRIAALFGVSILAVLATRLPLMPHHLYSFDSVNMALALDDFDPARHQPQSPGYPLFVGEARIVYRLLQTPERTFAALRILITGFAVALLYLLGKRMFSASVGAIAAILFFVNPVLWFSSLTSPLRPHLALVSILVAYFCWRSYCGESRYFYAASLALGLGGGFRPELSALLLPLWLMTAWNTRQSRIAVRGLLLLALGAVTWLGVLMILYHGMGRMMVSWIGYLSVQTSSTSMMKGASEAGWRRMIGRAFIWTGSGVLAWLWAVPFGCLGRGGVTDWGRRLTFLALWFSPLFLFQLIIHIGNPDHALSAIPVLCLLGAFCIAAASRWLRRYAAAHLGQVRLSAPAAALLPLAIAVIGNLILFFGRFPLPERKPDGSFRGLASVVNAFRVGTYESSYARVSWIEQTTADGLKQIAALKSGTNRPVLILWTKSGQPVWRKVSFYLPGQKVYALDEKGDPAVAAAMARVWSSNQVLTEYSGDPPFRIPIPKRARLIWLVGPHSAGRLKQVLPLREAPPIFYTDLSPNISRFRLGSFEFVSQ